MARYELTKFCDGISYIGHEAVALTLTGMAVHHPNEWLEPPQLHQLARRMQGMPARSTIDDFIGPRSYGAQYQQCLRLAKGGFVDIDERDQIARINSDGLEIGLAIAGGVLELSDAIELPPYRSKLSVFEMLGQPGIPMPVTPEFSLTSPAVRFRIIQALNALLLDGVRLSVTNTEVFRWLSNPSNGLDESKIFKVVQREPFGQYHLSALAGRLWEYDTFDSTTGEPYGEYAIDPKLKTLADLPDIELAQPKLSEFVWEFLRLNDGPVNIAQITDYVITQRDAGRYNGTGSYETIYDVICHPVLSDFSNAGLITKDVFTKVTATPDQRRLLYKVMDVFGKLLPSQTTHWLMEESRNKARETIRDGEKVRRLAGKAYEAHPNS
jgi:hypothetical protein